MGKGEGKSHTRRKRGSKCAAKPTGMQDGWLLGSWAVGCLTSAHAGVCLGAHRCQHISTASNGSCGGGSAGGANVGWCKRHVRDHPVGLSEVVQTDICVCLHQLCTLVAGCQPQRSVQQRNGRVEVPAVDRALSLLLQLLDRVDQPDLPLRRGVLGVEILKDVGVPTRCNIGSHATISTRSVAAEKHKLHSTPKGTDADDTQNRTRGRRTVAARPSSDPATSNTSPPAPRTAKRATQPSRHREEIMRRGQRCEGRRH